MLFLIFRINYYVINIYIFTPSISPKIFSKQFWKTSVVEVMPYGSLKYLYLPKGVVMTEYLALLSVNLIWWKARSASRVLKILLPDMRENSSSKLGIFLCCLDMYLFNWVGSMHILESPLFFTYYNGMKPLWRFCNFFNNIFFNHFANF